MGLRVYGHQIMKNGLVILCTILISAGVGFGLGYSMNLDKIRAAAMDAAVNERCGKEVPVVAIWHRDYDQVMYHFTPSPAQQKFRWCKGGK